MKAQGFPTEVVDMIKESVDCKLEFFGTKVPTGAMYLILCASIVLLIAIYIGMNIIAGKKRK